MSKTKTVALPMIRVEPELREELERVVESTQPRATLSAHVRQALLEYLDRRSNGANGQDSLTMATVKS